jgi:hypothetical protein
VAAGLLSGGMPSRSVGMSAEEHGDASHATPPCPRCFLEDHIMRRLFIISGLLTVFALAAASGPPAAQPKGKKGAGAEPVKFVTHRVGKFRSEACGVADFNKDGKLDIVAGPYVYLAPDWKPHKIRTL